MSPGNMPKSGSFVLQENESEELRTEEIIDHVKEYPHEYDVLQELDIIKEDAKLGKIRPIYENKHQRWAFKGVVSRLYKRYIELKWERERYLLEYKYDEEKNDYVDKETGERAESLPPPTQLKYDNLASELWLKIVMIFGEAQERRREKAESEGELYPHSMTKTAMDTYQEESD